MKLTSFLIRKNRHAEGKCIKNHAKADDFSSNSSRYSYTKNRHTEGKCIKEHAEIDEFLSKFEQKLKHEKIDTPQRNCVKLHTQIDVFCRNSSENSITQNGYAVGNCITQYAKIDDDSRFANFVFVFIRCESRTWIFFASIPDAKIAFFQPFFRWLFVDCEGRSSFEA